MTFCIVGKDWALVRGVCPLDPKPGGKDRQQAGGHEPTRDN